MKKNTLFSTNPAKNFQINGEITITTKEEIEEKVRLAQKARSIWKEYGVKKRIGLLSKLYEALLKKREEIALMGTREVGKPINESRLEFDFYIDYFKWFLDNGEKVLGDNITYEDEKSIHKVIYEPYGVAAVITPWNFPFGMFCWGATSNLIAGNTVVFKTSKQCLLTAKIIEKTVESVGLPKGVFAAVYGEGKEGEMLAKSNINFIWFTGSTEIGRRLYEIAAKKLIRCVFELGGSNPAIVFDDIDLNKIVTKIYAKKYKNCGQTCDALKRLIVQRKVFDKLVDLLKKELESKIVGDPESTKTDFGPLVSEKQLKILEDQMKDALKKGAKVIIGGGRQKGLKGSYYLPTLLTDVSTQMRVWKEEVFGPVLTVVPFDSEDQAIKLANDSEYGLGAIVFSADKERALRVAGKIDSGTVEINSAIHWLGCNPFGGYKNSGIGREHGKEGLRELTQIKVISIEK